MARPFRVDSFEDWFELVRIVLVLIDFAIGVACIVL